VTVRSLEARVGKLEAIGRRPDEMLVIWRRPGGDVAEALRGASFAKGDRVICIEWLGDDPLPEPRWHGKRSEFSAIENECIERVIDRDIESHREGNHRQRYPGSVELPHFPANRMCELSDNDLMHAIFGVET
jgi:hypothetical protein